MTRLTRYVERARMDLKGLSLLHKILRTVVKNVGHVHPLYQWYDEENFLWSVFAFS